MIDLPDVPPAARVPGAALVNLVEAAVADNEMLGTSSVSGAHPEPFGDAGWIAGDAWTAAQALPAEPLQNLDMRSQRCQILSAGTDVPGSPATSKGTELRATCEATSTIGSLQATLSLNQAGEWKVDLIRALS